MTVPVRLGDYELLCELGSGGMATLYIARQLGVARVERLVAVKRVHRHVLAAPGIQTMFRDEARLAALVRHANVVRVLDVVEVDGELLIVLDYIESVSLAMLRHAAGAALPLPVIARVIADALAGLHAAHEATDVRGAPLGIVHRDFSPQNILVGTDGTTHLIDFGVAKARARATQTESGVLKGKLAYMSPEQARGSEIDRRSDVFSAGIVLYEAATGARPFGAEASEAVLLQIMLAEVPPASTLAPGIPAALDAVIERALERARDERYQTAAELRDALVAAVAPASTDDVRAAVERWCRDPITARRTAVQGALGALDPTLAATPQRANEATRATPERRRWPLLVGGAAVLGLGAAGGVLWSARADRTAAQDAAPVARAVTHDAPVAAPPDAAPVDAPAPADVLPPEHAPPAKRAPPAVVATRPPEPAPPPAAVATRPSTQIFTTPSHDTILVLDHQVHLTTKVAHNTTTIPDAEIDRLAAAAVTQLLMYYRGAVIEQKKGMPPGGAETLSYTVQGGRAEPIAEPSTYIRSSLLSGLLGPVYQAARNHKDAAGRVDLAVTIDVK